MGNTFKYIMSGNDHASLYDSGYQIRLNACDLWLCALQQLFFRQRKTSARESRACFFSFCSRVEKCASY